MFTLCNDVVASFYNNIVYSTYRAMCIVSCMYADRCAVFRMCGACDHTRLQSLWCGTHAIYGVFYTPAVVCKAHPIKGCVLHTA